MSEYICTKAEILKGGHEVELSFQKVGSTVTRNTSTMTADEGQQAIHLTHFWNEEKKVVAHLGKRLDEVMSENLQLRAMVARLSIRAFGKEEL